MFLNIFRLNYVRNKIYVCKSMNLLEELIIYNKHNVSLVMIKSPIFVGGVVEEKIVGERRG